MKPIKKTPSDFTMLTRGYIADIRSLARRAPAAHQIFMFLVELMSKTNAVVISQSALCELLGYGRTTVHKATKLLVKERWVQVVKTGTSNGYIVNSKVIWRDKSGKRFASFFAEVVISESEQQHAEALDELTLRHVPIVRRGERVFDDGEPLLPPDQMDLLPPDPDEFPGYTND